MVRGGFRIIVRTQCSSSSSSSSSSRDPFRRELKGQFGELVGNGFKIVRECKEPGGRRGEEENHTLLYI
jgi:hypothetical protein